MKTTLGILVALAGLALLTGCQSVNPFQEAYKSTLQPGSEAFLLPHTGDPQLQSAPADLDPAVARLEQKGYLVIGYSSFVADAEDRRESLLAQARAVSADLVLVLVEPAASRTGVSKVSGFESGKDYSNMSSAAPAAAPGRGGGGTSEYSRPSGYSTPTFVNVSVEQNSYQAVFLRKRLLILGATVEPAASLPAGATAPFGMEVKSVIEDSPAYFADLKAGDILTAVEGKTFATKEEYQLLINAHAGAMTSVTYFRRGVERTVTIKLNPLPQR